MCGCCSSTSAVGQGRPSNRGSARPSVSSYSTRAPPAPADLGGCPDQQLGAVGPGGELQRFGTRDARCVAGRQMSVITQGAVAQRNEQVHVLVGRHIGCCTSCQAGAPQHGVALMDPDGAVMV